MSVSSDQAKYMLYMPNPWQEMEGTPKPGAQETADEAIRKVMNPIKREISRNRLPDLDPE